MPFCWFCHEAAYLSIFHRCELEHQSSHLSVIVSVVEIGRKIQFYCQSQHTVIIPSFRTHRSEEQPDQGLHFYLLFITEKLLVIQ